MNRKKGKEKQKATRSLIDHRDLERNVLTEISKELKENTNKKKNK